MLVLGTVTIDLFLHSFHGLQKSAEWTIGPLFFDLLQFSSLRYSLDLFKLNEKTISLHLSQSVKCKTCVATYTIEVQEY